MLRLADGCESSLLLMRHDAPCTPVCLDVFPSPARTWSTPEHATPETESDEATWGRAGEGSCGTPCISAVGDGHLSRGSISNACLRPSLRPAKHRLPRGLAQHLRATSPPRQALT